MSAANIGRALVPSRALLGPPHAASRSDDGGGIMNVLIIGAAGMIGSKLARRIAGDGSLAGKAISKLVLYDIVPCDTPAGIPVSSSVGDLSSAGEAQRIIAARPDI